MHGPRQVKDAADGRPWRKQLRIRPEAIAAARTALGTRSDSETTERALDRVIAWDAAWRNGQRTPGAHL